MDELSASPRVLNRERAVQHHSSGIVTKTGCPNPLLLVRPSRKRCQMSNSIHLELPRDSQGQSSRPVDEIVWQAWLKKNLLEEKQDAAAHIKAVTLACIGVLTVAAVVSPYVFAPYVSSYQALVRFAIGLGAIVLMFKSFRVRQYAFTGLFAAIVLLFNPVFPTFSLSGNWAILLASVLPFVASLVLMQERAPKPAAPTPALVDHGVGQNV
jgi:hypothetical protein